MSLASVPKLVAITDLTRFSLEHSLARAAELARLARPGTFAVLLRDREVSARERATFGRELCRIVRATRQELWIADRLDLALVLGADGVHLGEASVTAREARQLLGAERRISRAWHDPELRDEAALPELEGV